MDIGFEASVLEDGLDDDPPHDFVWAGDAEPRDWLIIVRGHEPDDAGHRHIMAEVEHHGRLVHEAVDSCELSATRLTVRFVRPLRSDWPVESVEVSFAGGCRPSNEFVARLRTIFVNHSARLAVTDSRPAA